MGGHFLEQSYQEWNANGQVNDCGIPGFGFNGGNWAQDFCIDNVWIEESSIDPGHAPARRARWTRPLSCESRSCRSADGAGQFEGEGEHEDRPDP
jgi:hypothetical protein